MKTLYMVRHAKSSWDNLFLSDHERPLNNRGKKNAPEMGKRLKIRGIIPDVLISSTAKRALSTARKIAREIGYKKENIVKTRLLYHSDEDDILDLIRQQNDGKGSIMLFGHNPGFTDCVNMLTNAAIANVPTCGIVEITFNTDRWSDINEYEGNLVFFYYSKNTMEQTGK